MAGALDGLGQAPLVTGASTGLAPRPNTTVLCHVATERVDVFIIYDDYVVGTEGASAPATTKTSTHDNLPPVLLLRTLALATFAAKARTGTCLLLDR